MRWHCLETPKLLNRNDIRMHVPEFFSFFTKPALTGLSAGF